MMILLHFNTLNFRKCFAKSSRRLLKTTKSANDYGRGTLNKPADISHLANTIYHSFPKFSDSIYSSVIVKEVGFGCRCGCWS